MMDNQYNYYRPDSDENRGADNQQGFGAGPQQNPKAPKPKKGYAKKVALVVGAAVLFGAVGGVTMQGTSYLTGKLLGKNTKSTVGTTKTVSNAKLTRKYRISSEESASRRVKAPDPVLSSARMIQNSWLLPITML